MNLEEKFKQKQGITLIALVVTIIVLLILAGITIAMLTGQNGILNRATEARDANGTAQIDEQVKLAVAEALSNGLGTITEDNLKKALDSNVGSGKYELTGDATNGWTIKAGEKTYKINGNGDISGDNNGGNTGDNDKNDTLIGGIYNEGGITEDQIAPDDLFEYEILNNTSKTASNTNTKMPTKTAKITRIKEKYCNILNGENKLDTEGNKIEDTNYEINYPGITNTLVIPYKVLLENPETKEEEWYKITEVCLAFICKASYSPWDVWNSLPSVENIIYPNTVEKIYSRGEGYEDVMVVGVNHNIKRVVLPQNINEIPEGFLAGGNKIESIDIPENVTRIEMRAFSGCTNLKEIDLKNVTQQLGVGAFEHCTSLKKIDMKNVTQIGREAFSGCTGLTEIDLKNVTQIGEGAFGGCTGLTEIDLKNVTQIGSVAFNGCTGLTKVDMKKVTQIGSYAFASCTGIVEIDLRNVTQVGYGAFYEWESNQKIKVPFASSDSLPNGWNDRWQWGSDFTFNAKIIYTDTNLD